MCVRLSYSYQNRCHHHSEAALFSLSLSFFSSLEINYYPKNIYEMKKKKYQCIVSEIAAIVYVHAARRNFKQKKIIISLRDSNKKKYHQKRDSKNK